MLLIIVMSDTETLFAPGFMDRSFQGAAHVEPERRATALHEAGGATDGDGQLRRG